MKRIQILSIPAIVMALMFSLASCSTQDLEGEEFDSTNPIQRFQSIDDIESMNFDAEFDLPDEVYNRFIDDVQFVGNQLGGFNYSEIEKELTDEQSSQFWSYFGVSNMRNGSTVNPVLSAGCYWPNMKPISGGCQPMAGWICFCPKSEIEEIN